MGTEQERGSDDHRAHLNESEQEQRAELSRDDCERLRRRSQKARYCARVNLRLQRPNSREHGEVQKQNGHRGGVEINNAQLAAGRARKHFGSRPVTQGHAVEEIAHERARHLHRELFVARGQDIDAFRTSARLREPGTQHHGALCPMLFDRAFCCLGRISKLNVDHPVQRWLFNESDKPRRQVRAVEIRDTKAHSKSARTAQSHSGDGGQCEWSDNRDHDSRAIAHPLAQVLDANGKRVMHVKFSRATRVRSAGETRLPDSARSRARSQRRGPPQEAQTAGRATDSRGGQQLSGDAHSAR
jgi:hypothetical protein